MNHVLMYAVINSNTHRVFKVTKEETTKTKENQTIAKVAINKEVSKGDFVVIWDQKVYEQAFALIMVNTVIKDFPEKLNSDEKAASAWAIPEGYEPPKTFIKTKNFKEAYQLVLEDMCKKYKKAHLAK